MITAEDLLAGASLTRDIVLPAEFAGNAATVRLRPLTVRDLQRIAKAVKDDDSLSAPFMIQQALVEPPLQFEQVLQLPARQSVLHPRQGIRLDPRGSERDDDRANPAVPRNVQQCAIPGRCGGVRRYQAIPRPPGPAKASAGRGGFVTTSWPPPGRCGLARSISPIGWARLLGHRWRN